MSWVMCEPSKKMPLVIADTRKAGTFMQSYYKGYSNLWTGRQYVLEYEEVDDATDKNPDKGKVMTLLNRGRNDGCGQPCIMIYEELDQDYK